MGYLRKIYMRNGLLIEIYNRTGLLTENIHEKWVTYGKYT